MEKTHIVKVPLEIMEEETQEVITKYLTSFLDGHKLISYNILKELDLNYVEVEITLCI